MSIVKKIVKNKFLRFINNLVIGLVIFVAIPAIVFILITSRTSVVFGIRSFDVMTGSMRPTLPTGSIVFTIPTDSYNKGDIITFNRGKIAVTHRIVGINNDQFNTKGDANKSVDGPVVNKGDIIGKNVLMVPYLGKFTSFIKTLPGFLLFMVLPTVIFVILEFLTIKKEWEKVIEQRVLKRVGMAQ